MNDMLVQKQTKEGIMFWWDTKQNIFVRPVRAGEPVERVEPSPFPDLGDLPPANSLEILADIARLDK